MTDDNPELKAKLDTYKKDIQERLNNDLEIASYIKTVTEGRHALIFYGIFHGSEENDLDEALGSYTLKIFLASSILQPTLEDKQILNSMRINPEAPAAIFIVEENKIIPVLDRDLDSIPEPTTEPASGLASEPPILPSGSRR